LFGQENTVSTPGLIEKARKEAANATIDVQRLRGNVSVLMGAGGNIAVLPGRDGKLIIDAGYAGARPRIADALASISADPIKQHLINTHWHFDHTDGNVWVHEAGARILAHENTRKHLSTDTRVVRWDFTFARSPAGAIPTDTFTTEWSLELNGAKIALQRYAPAHTDSDISAHFTDIDVIHVGDTFWNGFYHSSTTRRVGASTERSALPKIIWSTSVPRPWLFRGTVPWEINPN